ncbi:MMPL family transporter [Dactylosporangium sp. NPDC005555]|uniref:MMPL family transporter n=1 Tax=Dactylosporangium sp. NPDC005555 TaxID=3154889 RepID=UPI0033ABAC8F
MQKVRMTAVAVFAYGTVAHLVQLATGGYPWAPAWLAGYFVALTVLDPLAAVLLALRRPAGLYLGIAVLVSDAAANGYATYGLDAGGGTTARVAQAVITLLAVGLIAVTPMLLRPSATRHRATAPAEQPEAASGRFVPLGREDGRMADGFMARVGSWCFRRRWWVLGVWLVAVIGGVLAAGPLLNAISEGNTVRKKVESIEAYDLLSTAEDSAGQVVGLVDGVDPAAADVRAAVDAATARLRGVGHVRQVDATAVSADGRALLVVATLEKVDKPTRNDAVDRVEAELVRLEGELPAGADVRVGGSAAISRDAGRTLDEDRTRAELLSLPLTLVVLVIVFGGLIAAGVPVLAAVVSVASVFPVLYAFTTFTDVDSNALTVASLLGLGLSVDYGLLLVARYREELAAGFAPDVAIGRAWATAGRTILFSALTVAAALAGLLAFSVRQLTALGAAGVSIALVAMLVSLTFTAALIGLARRRLKPARRSAEEGDASGKGFFAVLAALVQRRAALVAVVTAALLLAAGLPLLSATVKLPGQDGIPRGIESVRVADELKTRFGRAFAPTVTLVARTGAADLDAYAARWANDPAVGKVQPAKPVGAGLSAVQLSLRGGAQDDAAQELVGRIRADRPAGVQSWVTGDAAVLVDLIGLIIDDLPLALGITLTAMLVLLFAMTGSLVVPVKAILANVVSLGVMVAVFEHGWLSGVLGTLTVGGLDPFVVVILFGFAFALSMDYEVFLLGRIKEYVDGGDDTDTAVRRGLQHTGRVITSAALLMVIVFGCFAAAQMGSIEQIGLGLTTAVLIDATVVRCLLVPATMTLLGRWNWWSPAPLRRLHQRIGLKELTLPPAGEPAMSGAQRASTDA